MTYLPCRDPENDPDDWFIEADGKQYVEDNLLTEAQIEEIHVSHDGAPAEVVDAALDEAEAEALKRALQRRRHAKDKCFTQCEARLQCLGMRLDGPASGATSGIFGGYYPRELRAIEAERDRRNAE